MCWSAGVSFATFFVSAACGVFITIAYKSFSPLYWNFIVMQLFEGMMWLDQGCGRLNALATAAASLAISLQPLSSLLSKTGWNRAPDGLLCLYAVGAVFFACVTRKTVALSGRGYCTRPPDDSRHLSWPFLPRPFTLPIALWFAMYFYPMVAYSDGSAHDWISVTFQAAVVLVSIRHGKNNGTWGTNWCYYANITGIYLVARRFLFG